MNPCLCIFPYNCTHFTSKVFITLRLCASHFLLPYLSRIAALISASIFFAVGDAVATPLDDANSAYSRGAFSEAFAIYQSLAKDGNSDALSHLCVMYYKGEGVSQNYVKAMSLCELASFGLNGTAIFYRGLMFENGQGVVRNEAEAIKLYGLAASLYDNIDAQKRIQFLAEQGKAQAQDFYASMLLKGNGVKKNPVQAHYWYRRAAIQGDPKAQTNLGAMYLAGDGIPKNPTIAYMWFRISSDLGEWTSLFLDAAATQMTDDQLVQAKKLVTACKESHFRDCP